MLNVVVIMGRLTADPELKTTQSGISVMSFSVAVNRSYSKDGNSQTDFINCVAWRNTAEFISRYFAKGQMIAIKGSLQQRSYEDKNGNKRTTYEVLIDNASFCGSKNETQESSQNTNNDLPLDDFDDVDINEVGGDLPF